MSTQQQVEDLALAKAITRIFIEMRILPEMDDDMLEAYALELLLQAKERLNQ